MPTRLDKLKSEETVFHRSSERISRKKAAIFFDDKSQSIVVRFKDEPAHTHTPDEKIAIAEIQTVKAKDFSEHDVIINVLSIYHGPGEARHHTSFQFEKDKQEARNTWDQGLRSLLTGAVQSAKGTEVKVPGSKYKPIKAITLQKPLQGQVVRISVDLGDGDGHQVDLVIPENKTSSDECKRIATEFVENNVVLPTETTSLYRYIRSVVQRAQMETEVVKIVNEINAQNFDEVSKARTSQLSDAESKQLLDKTNERLDNLKNEIPTRVGQHGSGATIVTQVLKRNIDKMRLINEMAAKLAMNSSAVV